MMEATIDDATVHVTSKRPSRNPNVDWSRFGLGSENASRPRGNLSGFVDLGNEYDYAAGGHHASGANELFAEEQVGKKLVFILYLG